MVHHQTPIFAAADAAEADSSDPWPRFEQRMRCVVEHVYAHLDEPLALLTLADISHLSSHHWHRTYHALYGETMAASVKRLRLHRAAGWLANSALPVAQIARQSGYPNLQSFTRLFKGEYGLPPARYRAAGQHTGFAGPSRVEPGAAHAVAIRALPAVDEVAIEHLGPYMQIGQAFDTLFGRVAALGLVRPGVRMLARFFDDPTAVPEAALRLGLHCRLRAGRGGRAAAAHRPPRVGMRRAGPHRAVCIDGRRVPLAVRGMAGAVGPRTG